MQGSVGEAPLSVQITFWYGTWPKQRFPSFYAGTYIITGSHNYKEPINDPYNTPLYNGYTASFKEISPKTLNPKPYTISCISRFKELGP